MKEILYIQAGVQANYVGTHFWNTQESYFSDAAGGIEDGELVEQDVSFVQRQTRDGYSALYPRLIIFDHKANFGRLSQSSALYDVEDPVVPRSWTGDVTEFTQEPIPPSRYHEQMQDGTDNALSNTASETQIRFWSDFNRVDFLPRTVQKLPDAESGSSDGIGGAGESGSGWNAGIELFAQLDRILKDTALMDDSVRLFVEECDLLQGIQVVHETAKFGAFVNAFLASSRDEFTKLPILVFPLLSESSVCVDFDDRTALRKILNDIVCLRDLNELCSILAPVQAPDKWSPQSLGDGLNVDIRSPYQTSAVVSAHIESSTLPLRMKKSPDDIGSFCSQLNWRGSTRIAELGGAFPIIAPVNHNLPCFNLFSMQREQPWAREELWKGWIARRDVLRGFSQVDMQVYATWTQRCVLQEPFLRNLYAPAYPLPTSFPSIFKSPALNRGVIPRRRKLLASPRSTAMMSSMTTTSQSAVTLKEYAELINRCTMHTPAALEGLHKDELRELGNDLWTMVDNYASGSDEL